MDTDYPEWVTEHPVKDVRPALSAAPYAKPGQTTPHAFTLTLTTGEEVVGCAYCPRVGPSTQAITTGHLSAAHPEHTEKGRAGKVGRPLGAKTVPGHILDWTVGDLLRRAGQAEDVSWRTRALAAERELRDLRKVLRRVVGEDEQP